MKYLANYLYWFKWLEYIEDDRNRIALIDKVVVKINHQLYIN